MFPQPVTAHVHQNLRYNLWCNTEFFYSPGYASTVLKLRSTYEQWQSDGRKPYFVYLGASTPLGILGFVDMILELREQIDAGVVSPIESAFAASTELPWSTMKLDRSHFGGSYGIPTREGMTAKDMLAQREHVTLEATYTAKTMAAMLADARREPGKKLMMLHTYNGVPYPDDMPELEHLPEEMQWTRSAKFATPVEV